MNPDRGKMTASGVLCLISAIIKSLAIIGYVITGIILTIGSFFYKVEGTGLYLDDSTSVTISASSGFSPSLFIAGISLLVSACVVVIMVIFNFRHAARMFKMKDNSPMELASFYNGANPVGFLVANILLGGGITGIIGAIINLAVRSSVRYNSMGR